MPESLHHSLQHQLHIHLPAAEIPVEWEPLLESVNRAYYAAESDRQMLEHSLEQASLELRRRNEELRQLLDANPDLCLRLNPEGLILEWYGHRGHEDFWGELAPQQPFYIGLPVELIQQLQEALAHVLTHQQAQLLEFELPGQDRMLELRFVPLFGTQCLLMIRNTTERNHWEAQLARRNRQLLSFHVMAEIIMTSGSLQEAYDRIVAELHELTGFESVAIEFYDPHRQSMIIQATNRPEFPLALEIPVCETLSGLVAISGVPLIEAEALERKEYTHPGLRQLGVQTFVCIPLATATGVLGTLSLGSPQKHDVDEAFVKWMTKLALYLVLLIQRKQAEMELLQSKQEAEAANQAKNRFLATMSHELRTPLNGVLGFARVLLKSEQPLEPRAQVYLERIHSNGLHLLNLISDVLDISRIETGHQEVHLSPVALPELIGEVLAECEPLMQRKGLHWCLEFEPGLNSIISDQARLRQIITNLLNNAIKFTPESGTIWVRIKSRDGVPLILEVQDSGIGIAPELQEKIFEAFFQVDSSYARMYDGTGLGLAICRSLAQILGYRLDLASQPGQGACFIVYLAAQD